MEMTPGEIALEYRLASDKSKQMTILADLNLCSRDDIRKILIEEGALPYLKPKKALDVPKQKKERTHRKCRYEDMITKSVSDHLLEYIEQHCLTKQEMACILDVTPASLTNYTLRKKAPNVNTLIGMADEMGLTLDELVGRA